MRKLSSLHDQFKISFLKKYAPNLQEKRKVRKLAKKRIRTGWIASQAKTLNFYMFQKHAPHNAETKPLYSHVVEHHSFQTLQVWIALLSVVHKSLYQKNVNDGSNNQRKNKQNIFLKTKSNSILRYSLLGRWTGYVWKCTDWKYYAFLSPLDIRCPKFYLRHLFTSVSDKYFNFSYRSLWFSVEL